MNTQDTWLPPSWHSSYSGEAAHKRWLRRVLTMTSLALLPILIPILAGCNGQNSAETKVAAKNEGATETTTSDSKTNYQGVTFRVGYGKGGAAAIVKLQGTLEKRFKPLGVNVEWLQFPMGPQMMEGIGAGSLDLGSCASTPPIFAQAAGVNFVYVASVPPGKSNGAILIPKDSPIKSVKDLKGKRIAFQPGSVWHYNLVKILEQNGLKYEDVVPAKMPPADSSSAFNSGSIDAWIQGEPYVTLAQRKSGARILVTTAKIGNTGGFFLGAKERVKQYPELFKIALEEIQRAGHWSKANPHEAALLTAERVGLDVPTVEKNIRDGNNTRFNPVTPDIVKSQQDQANLFYGIKILPKQIEVQEKVLSAEEYKLILPDPSYGAPEKRVAAAPESKPSLKTP